MTLADYLGSEQAREDVRRAIRELATCDGLAYGIDFGWMRAGIIGAWRRVAVEQGQGAERIMTTAYYRPDGERFVVTDLGEGVRAACLRGLDLANTEHFDRLNALGRTLDDDFRQTAPLGWIELRDVKPADLPDALCRVMLASLKVAEVQP